MVSLVRRSLQGRPARRGAACPFSCRWRVVGIWRERSWDADGRSRPFQKIRRDGEAHKDTFLAYMQRPMPAPIAWRFRHRIGAVPAYLHDPGCGNEYGGGGGPPRARPQAPAGNRARPRDRTAIPAVVIVSARHHRGWPTTDGQGSRRAGLQPRADQGRASPPQGPAINGSAGVGRDAPRRWHRRSSRAVSQRA